MEVPALPPRLSGPVHPVYSSVASSSPLHPELGPNLKVVSNKLFSIKQFCVSVHLSAIPPSLHHLVIFQPSNYSTTYHSSSHHPLMHPLDIYLATIHPFVYLPSIYSSLFIHAPSIHLSTIHSPCIIYPFSHPLHHYEMNTYYASELVERNK